MTDPTTSLDVFIALATGASALATAIAAIVVARQTFWTRRAVEVAEEGTVLSRTMAVEATKTRLDVRAARISVTANGPVLWPAFAPSSFGEANQLEVGQEFILPRDAEFRVMLRLFLEITNHEDYPVSIGLQGLSHAGEHARASLPSEWTISKGSTEPFRFDASRTVAEWVAIHRGSYVEGIGAPEFQATVGHSDPYDDGVIDSWLVIVAGFPLIPVPDKEGHWEIAPERRPDVPSLPSAVGLVRPMTRRYYVSKKENTPLETQISPPPQERRRKWPTHWLAPGRHTASAGGENSQSRGQQ